MRIKTSELTRDALDWAMATCNGMTLHYFVDDWFKKDPWLAVNGEAELPLHAYTPSTAWTQGGPIIERERISLEFMPGAGDAGADVWVATRVEGSSVSEECAESPLVAAMRCYVASQLGDEVEVPEGM